MTRKKILIFILFDLVVLGLLGFRLWQRYRELVAERMPVSTLPAEKPSPAPVVSTETVTLPESSVAPVTTPVEAPPVVNTAPVSAPAPTPVNPAPKGPPREIHFRYTDPRAKRVQLAVDQNKWRPQEMRKTGSSLWETLVMLPPGDHAYQFIVDGRPTRDPNQPRTAPNKRSLMTVSSAAQ